MPNRKIDLPLGSELSIINISRFSPPTNLVFFPWNAYSSWKKKKNLLFFWNVWLKACYAASAYSLPSISSRNLERHFLSRPHLLLRQPEYLLNPRKQKNWKWEWGEEQRKMLITKCRLRNIILTSHPSHEGRV